MSDGRKNNGRKPGTRIEYKWLRAHADANFFVPSGPPPRPAPNKNRRNVWTDMTEEERKAYSAKLCAKRTTDKLNAAEKAKIGRPQQANKHGIPPGWKRSEYEAIMKMKEPIIEELMEKITSGPDFPTFELPSDEDMAKQALRFHLETLAGPHSVKDKQKSADSVLKFTRAKPAEKHDLTINPAEAFLMSLMAKDDAAE